MSWANKVRKALGSASVRNGIAMMFVEAMANHIDQSQGRGSNGGSVPHKPLKPMFGQHWTRKPVAGESVVQTRDEVVVVYKKPTKAAKKRARGQHIPVTRIEKTITEYLVRSPSYRNGGHPLRNTGKMERSLNAKGANNSTGMQITLRGVKYALFQDQGFTTNKPNYIPISAKGARGHGTGMNPRKEGLRKGKDYMMAWGGVTVPARPFLLPTKREIQDIGKSIAMSLKIILKGK
jgi:phage gpG-like protein